MINDSANHLTPSIPDSPEAIRGLSHKLKSTEGAPKMYPLERIRMATRPMRFAAILCAPGSMADLLDQARSAVGSGCDVVLLPDHIGWVAPIPSLVAVAAAIPSVRVGNCVLNTAFYRPALLARDLAAVDWAIGGRLEIGLGAGYVAEEFATVGLRFPAPSERMQLLDEHVQQIRATFADPNFTPTPIQQAHAHHDRRRW